MNDEMIRHAVATPAAPSAKGPYSQAIRYGGLLFLVGQVPIDPKTSEWLVGMMRVEISAIAGR